MPDRSRTQRWLHRLVSMQRFADINQPIGRVRLQTVVILRWLAVGGQLAAVIFVHFALGFDLPLGFCLTAIAALAWLNVFLTLRHRPSTRLPEWQAAVYFAIDLGQFAVLVFLTGGLQNPFALLFMAPVTISATTLSLRSTVLLLGLSIVYVTLLVFFHMPLPWYAGEPMQLPPLLVTGNWVALVLGLVFMSVYAWRVAQESRRMSDALAATQFVLARAQRLSALDGLAAAAAHELGTPLGTISLVAKELMRGGQTDAELRDDLALLAGQAERCKDILSKLSRRPDDEDAVHSRLPLHVLLDEIVEPHRDMDVLFDIRVTTDDPDAEEPDILRRPEMLYGLGNFVENAADFARHSVEVTGRYDRHRIMVTIRDDGPGFTSDVLERLGEPYVTTRPRKTGANLSISDPEGAHEGMGLGFFIGKTLLERTGALVDIGNRLDEKSGALVTVRWERKSIEAEAAFPRPASNWAKT